MSILSFSFDYKIFSLVWVTDVDCRGLEQSGRSMMHCYLRDSDWSRYRNVVDARHQRMVKDVLCRAAPNVGFVKFICCSSSVFFFGLCLLL